MKKQFLLILPLLASLSGCISITNTTQTGENSKHAVKADSDMTPTTTTKGSLGVGVGQAPNVTSGAVK